MIAGSRKIVILIYLVAVVGGAWLAFNGYAANKAAGATEEAKQKGKQFAVIGGIIFALSLLLLLLGTGVCYVKEE
jgi:cytochrome c biogenesis factor